MELEPDALPREKLYDLTSFWAETMARDYMYPLANKVDFIDKFFQRHASKLGTWCSLPGGAVETDYLCQLQGKGRLAKAAAASQSSRQSARAGSRPRALSVGDVRLRALLRRLNPNFAVVPLTASELKGPAPTSLLMAARALTCTSAHRVGRTTLPQPVPHGTKQKPVKQPAAAEEQKRAEGQPFSS
jgi:hypothetical protein